VDFALFMERYGYKILLVVLFGGVFVFIFGLLGYEMYALAHYTSGEVAFFLGLLFFVALVAAKVGGFMDRFTTTVSRVGYSFRAKLFEDKKRLQREREKLREEGGRLY